MESLLQFNMPTLWLTQAIQSVLLRVFGYLRDGFSVVSRELTRYLHCCFKPHQCTFSYKFSPIPSTAQQLIYHRSWYVLACLWECVYKRIWLLKEINSGFLPEMLPSSANEKKRAASNLILRDFPINSWGHFICTIPE